MVNQNYYQPPDLASVLQTLAQFAPARAPAPAPPHGGQGGQGGEGEQRFAAPEPAAAAPPPHPPAPPDAARAAASAPVAASAAPPAAPAAPAASAAPAQQRASPAVDITSIIDWPSGLRSVMKTVARNDASLARIKEIMAIQREHEVKWFEGRKQLVKRIEDRQAGRKKLDDILRSVGGSVKQDGTGEADSEDPDELPEYDKKVYAAMIEMEKSFSLELTGMGVPFFRVQARLVTGASAESLSGRSPPFLTGGGQDSDASSPPTATITVEELLSLQNKVIKLLEHMCAE